MSASTATSKPKPSRSAAGKDKDGKVHKLSLKGSAKLVAEFSEYSINSILFQRGVYPAEDFTAVKKYGLNMLVTADEAVRGYIRKMMSQLSKWMIGGKVKTLVVVISSKDSGEVLERWQFDVLLLSSSSTPAGSSGDGGGEGEGGGGDENAARKEEAAGKKKDKTEQIQAEIQSLFRQITASVTFLPMLDGRCTFNVLVYADGDAEVPIEWGDSDAKEIVDGEKVTLRSWGTSSHRVDTLVSYRLAD